nr:MAG TPA: hypothetical protein [Caudoviricetes sp.]
MNFLLYTTENLCPINLPYGINMPIIGLVSLIILLRLPV